MAFNLKELLNQLLELKSRNEQRTYKVGFDVDINEKFGVDIIERRTKVMLMSELFNYKVSTPPELEFEELCLLNTMTRHDMEIGELQKDLKDISDKLTILIKLLIINEEEN